MEDKIESLAQELIDKLGFKAGVTVSEEGGIHRIHFETEEDASMLIGKHARMLAALQRVLGAMLYKKMGEKVDILVDVNDYRDAQKERLIGIADNVAQRVLDEGRPARLSSFNAYERKIIHEHISSNYQSLQSYSEGEGRFRRLVITRQGEDNVNRGATREKPLQDAEPMIKEVDEPENPDEPGEPTKSDDEAEDEHGDRPEDDTLDIEI